MRTILSYGLVALTLSTLALACANSNDPQPAKDPVAGQLNQNQTPTSHPTPQDPNDPLARNGENHSPRNPHDPVAGQLNQNQTPASNPSPQNSTLPDPASQKPFYLGGEGNGGNKVLAKTEKPLTDAEVLGVVLTANEGEVQMAEQAIKKAKSKEVKDFAIMMKTHHTQGATKTKSIVTKTKMTQKDSDLSTFLKNDTEKTLKDLQNKEGADFDKAYMESQVAAHKAVLAAIDNRLVPSAQQTDVKSLVTETRKTVADHVAKAEEVQKKVDAMASNDTDQTAEPTTAKAKTTTTQKGSEKGLAPRP